MQSKDDVIIEIMEKKSLSEEEVEELIQKEIDKYSGLLTEDGAAVLVAKNLGINTSTETESSKISLLKEGMHGITLKAVFSYISPIKKIKRGEKEFFLVTATASDSSGEILLKLWNEKASFLSDNKIERGDCILIKNAYVGSYKDTKELNLSFDSVISQVDCKDIIPPESTKTVSIPVLKEGMDDVNIYCRIRRLFEEKTFKKDFKEGRLLAFEVENSSGKEMVRAVAWNDAVDSISGLQQGDIIKIEAAQVKENNGGLELHLGWKSRVLLNPIINNKK